MNRNADLQQLGKRIRALRVDINLSQEEFANKIGMARSFYGCIERGEKNVSALNLIKIAASLNVTVGELFNFIEK